jgi:hypothetical protein
MPKDSSNRAFGSAEKARKKAQALEYSTVQRMLPLIRAIVRDIVSSQHQLNKLTPELESLERHRSDLSWLERQRRYHVSAEVEAAEKTLQQAVSELQQLGVTIVDRSTGQVAFPTRINGRPAAFSWQPEDDTVKYWHYEEENTRRPIPTDWVPGTPMRTKKP